jgi:DNA polymerase zeta
VYGIDFYSVIWRGSQFRVESIMSRITRPENFIMISPTKKQVRLFSVHCFERKSQCCIDSKDARHRVLTLNFGARIPLL